MIKYNKEYFTLNIRGDKHDQMCMIEALISAIELTKDDEDTLFELCKLLRALMPCGEQIVGLDDAKMINDLKNI